MGVIQHEEEANRSAIPGCHQGAGDWAANARNSQGSFGRWSKASGLCGEVSAHQGSSVASGQSGVLQGENLAARIRTNNSRVTRTPGIHCEEMGGGRQKQAGSEAMKTLVIANQKGGVGKTATVVHLAFDFLERGNRVAVVDLDTQSNASYSLQNFDSGYKASDMFGAGEDRLKEHFKDLPEGPLLSLIAADTLLANMEKHTPDAAGKALRANVTALEECGFDIVLIDTAPSLGVSMVAALYSGDFVLSPIELEAYSIQGIKKMVLTITNIRKANPGLKFLGMLPSKVDSRNPRHKRHLDELRAAYPELMIPARIGLRSSIADALASCVPVWKIKKTAARKAAQEIRELANFVFERICASDIKIDLKRRVA